MVPRAGCLCADFPGSLAQAETCVGIPVNCLLFLSNFNRILVKLSIIKFHENSYAILKVLHADRQGDMAKLIGTFLPVCCKHA